MTNNNRAKSESYSCDKLVTKIINLESDIKEKFGKDFLQRIFDYSFKQANQQAKLLALDKISDEFERERAFGRLLRFKKDYTLIEISNCINILNLKGYDSQQIRDYFTPERIAEVVCFE